jgi:iron(III) transport system substrate-binding protein
MKRATELLLSFSLVMGLTCEILTTPAISQELKRESIIEGAKKEGKLQIYALLVVADHMQIIQRFKEKYPFINVALYRTTSERLYTRIETEARANTHLADVIGISGFQMYQLVKRGLMAKYESPERRYFEPGFKDKDGYWTAYYVNPIVTAYNTRQVSPRDAAKDYADLLDPKWKGKLVMEDEEIEWFSTMMSFWGDEKGTAYMKRLAAQNFNFRHGHTLMTQLVAAGEYPGAVFVYGPQTQFIRSTGAPIDWNALNPTVAGVNLMGVAARAPHPNAAQLYVDHMLSEEIQRDFLAGKFFKVSARKGVANAIQQKLANVKVIPVDISQSEHLDKHSKKYREIFLAGQ